MAAQIGATMARPIRTPRAKLPRRGAGGGLVAGQAVSVGRMRGSLAARAGAGSTVRGVNTDMAARPPTRRFC